MNVLVAEDDYRVADIHCQYLLGLQGINDVKRVATAKEMLLEVEKWKPDLVLLDVYLPDELGVDMITQLKKICPTLQVILITAATDMEILRKAYQVGIVDYLVKPIALERLAEAVEKAEKNQQILQSNDEITQRLADKLFRLQPTRQTGAQDLPKGIDQITLEKVKELLQEQEEGITAEALGQLLGASRTTSRRYLEYLISIKEARAELVYGIVGRPERKYLLPNK
ncbi:response regulator [Sutcliffiella rhizosphaerae]|uniref:Transcriptional regulatory protein CitT n=1 Tax=Sutcliffiella rhizosphaerae TaxID=2880967 RepID=A0ABN8AC22_9BACI|nr:response regulator [Sutcliffiella rhizosphaerae]CAG9622768.1 Transcriptional regulatory protein CitT [Sutcliffiella rhizosphaerae]